MTFLKKPTGLGSLVQRRVGSSKMNRSVAAQFRARFGAMPKGVYTRFAEGVCDLPAFF